MHSKTHRGHWMQMDNDYSMICPCIYDAIEPYMGNYAPVCLNGKWGTLNLFGKVAIPIKYAFIPHIQGEKAVAAEKTEDGRFQFRIVNVRGRPLKNMVFDELEDAVHALEDMDAHRDEALRDPEPDFSSIYLGLWIDGEPFTYDTRQHLLLPSIHGTSVPLSCEYSAALLKTNSYSAKPGTNKWGLIHSRTNQPLLPFIFEDINLIHMHHIKVKRHGKWGIAYGRISSYAPQADSI